MLFYAMLTVAGIVAAAVLLWVIKSITEAGKSAYQTLSPSARNRSRTRLAHLNQNLAAAPSPWGWSSNNRNAVTSRTFTDNHEHRRPTPRIAEREQPTLTSRSLRSGSSDLLAAGLKDPRKTGSVRNLLTGYDLAKVDPVTTTSSWQYREIREPDDGPSLSAGRHHANRPGHVSAGEASAHAAEKEEQDAPNRQAREKPWGW